MCGKMKAEETGAMAMEVITFLREWGLWRDTMILAGGNMYSFSSDAGDVFGGMENVAFTEGVDPEEYTGGLTEAGDGSLVRRSLANPEHIFDMVFEGPLQLLLRHGEYEPDLRGISEAGWMYIFANTDLIPDYILTEHEVGDPAELGLRMWEELFDDPEKSYWDPLVFDSWEEYLEFCGGEDGDETPACTRFDTYGEYRFLLEGGAELFVKEREKEIRDRWGKLEQEAIDHYMDIAKGACFGGGEIRDQLRGKVKEHVLQGFNEIFERHGLWYELDFDWSLSCYPLSSEGRDDADRDLVMNH